MGSQKQPLSLITSTVLVFITLSTTFGQDNMLCMGAHWTEDEANLMLKQFASEWHNLSSWEDRTTIIRQGIISGMQLKRSLTA